ncbi:MAG: hypothetical protein FWC57_03850 [Endomicrobia bacterium]|nr:hypothetical protein [Endomicrobiia bacterium]
MFRIFLLLSGIGSAFIVQLLFREIMPVFQADDIVAGMTAAHFIMAFSLGIYTASAKRVSSKPRKNLLYSTVATALLVMLSFVFIRSIRSMLPVAPGAGISLKTTFIYVFAAVAPIAFFQGAAAYLSALFLKSEGVKDPIQNSFAFQCAGFIAASLVFSFFMVSFPGVLIALFAAVILFWASALLAGSRRQTITLAVLSAVCFLALVTDFIAAADKKTAALGFAPAAVEEFRFSPYGQTVLTQHNNEYSLFANNILLFSVPDDDILNSEDFGHIPILYAGDPQNVLIIGGAAKYLPMIFAHNVSRVDYMEPDEAVIGIVKKYMPHLGYVFEDARLRIFNGGSRDLINKTGVKYDLVLVGLPNPVNLQTGGFYTAEFFKKASELLNDGGVLALKLPGRMAFSTYLTAKLNKSVMDAMKSVFSYVQIIPGGQNILIASRSKLPYRFEIKQRLSKVQETALVLSKYYLDDKMDTERTRWLQDELKKTGDEDISNTDRDPKAVLLSILHMQSGFSPYLSLTAENLSQYSYLLVAIVIAVFFLSKSVYKITAFVCGASVIWLDFSALFALQIYGGEIFKWLGLLAALFSAGIFSGAAYTKFMKDSVPLNKRMFYSELLFVLWIILFIVSYIFSAINPALICLMVAGSGFLSGMEFFQLVKASKLMHGGKKIRLKTFMFTAAGGWFAAVLGGSFLILAWGLEKSLLFILFMKFLIFARWADLSKRGL